MGCGVTCLKGTLITINILFGLLGGLMLAVSIYTLTEGNESITEEVQTELSNLNIIPQGFGLEGVNPMPSGGAEVDIASALTGVAIFAIVLGFFLLFTSIVAAVGVCHNNGCLVASYAIFLVILFVIQAFILGLLYFGVLDGRIKEILKDRIEDDYVGVDSYTGFSLTWNLVMVNLECCGVENYTDFSGAVHWRNPRNFSVNNVVSEVTLQTPLACCKFNPDYTPVSQDCASNPTAATSNFEEGCLDAIRDEADEHKAWVIGFLAGVLGFQLLLILAVFYIICETEEEKELDF